MLTRTINRIISVVFPPLCARCRKILKNGSYFCSECDRLLHRVADPLCLICGLPLPETSPLSHPCGSCLSYPPSYDWHRSGVVYDNGVDSVIHRFKYFAESHLVGVLVDGLMTSLFPLLSGADFLIPVPLSADRLRRRTFNQSLELARGLSQKTGIPVTVHALRKIRETKPQTSLPRKERLENLRKAFVWKKDRESIEGKNVVLVDDVFTTGSTLSACARVLKKEKAGSVGAVTVAFNVPK